MQPPGFNASILINAPVGTPTVSWNDVVVMFAPASLLPSPPYPYWTVEPLPNDGDPWPNPITGLRFRYYTKSGQYVEWNYSGSGPSLQWTLTSMTTVAGAQGFKINYWRSGTFGSNAQETASCFQECLGNNGMRLDGLLPFYV